MSCARKSALSLAKKVTLPPGRHKIVILDEADSMTEGAQQALRRTMEIYSATTRFGLACNNSGKIIEPIQSRCAILRFTQLTQEQILRRLLQVLEAENVRYDDSGLDAIIFTADGDMRQALNNLQATNSGFGFINHTNVFKICDQPHPAVIKAMLEACTVGDVASAFEKMRSLWQLGYSAVDIVGTVFRVIKDMNMDEFFKLEYIREISITHMRMAEGVASLLQLTGLIARLASKAELRNSKS
eukprot:gnl/Spiro4/21503_TR10532_c0_g1_i1.p1 gnl/Spiro4/21503_TR10532_c0_g1~~gnl/Spiro4/21503_TR10532_c0_g1_i1.p1  ORF type:complete len:243 (+),score=64.74 gnl/Spiro4/21503_TR10532_c0_g1_i1:288-1016(+)